MKSIVSHRAIPQMAYRATTTHLGQMSLKSSILIRPAGLSPMEMSKKTTGRPSAPAPGIVAGAGVDILCLLLRWRCVTNAARLLPDLFPPSTRLTVRPAAEGRRSAKLKWPHCFSFSIRLVIPYAEGKTW